MKYNKSGLIKPALRTLLISKVIIAKHKRITSEEFYKYINKYPIEFKNELYVKYYILNNLYKKGEILLVPAKRSFDGETNVFNSYNIDVRVWSLLPKFQTIYEKVNKENSLNFTIDPRIELLNNELKEALKYPQ